MITKNLTAIAVGAVLALVAIPASAHHGWGGQATNESDMTGKVVKSVSLAGPHATMQIDVEGKVYDITLAPPFRTRSAGLTDGMIPVGETVTVHGNRSRDANRNEMKTIHVVWKGKTYSVYPERE
ncbi:MAG: hypothetical protein EXR00_00565 [Alphaproteobacteria bacterium]|nr:hypothetical protein [Alphaproteobacteria bacterium]